MGYTHYWYREPVAEAGAFAAWAEDVRRIVAYAGEAGIAVAGPDGSGEPVITPEYVGLNGAGRESYENFSLEQSSFADPLRTGHDGLVFDFCKTARRPYDAVVCAALIRLQRHFPRWVINSDGDHADWDGALWVCRYLFGEGELPSGVRSEDTLSVA